MLLAFSIMAISELIVGGVGKSRGHGFKDKQNWSASSE